MRIRPIRFLLARSDRAGMFIATVGMAWSFQRTLMPRKNIDQAIVTGLSAGLNYQLGSLVHDVIEAVVSGVLVGASRGRTTEADPTTLRRVTQAINVAGIVGGLALQRSLPQTGREPLTKAAGRTLGFWMTAGSAAGFAVDSLDQFANAVNRRTEGDHKVADWALPLLGGAAVAAVRDYQRRRAEAAHAVGEREGVEVSAALALPMGLGVGLVLAWFGYANRVFATLLGLGLDKVLPGDERLWRPAGHVVSLAVLVAGVAALVQWVDGHIENASDKIEPAYDEPPTSPLVSSGPASHVSWRTLGYKGRRYVSTAVKRELIEQALGEQANDPIRIYVGLDSAPTPEERVRLAIRELDRTDAFARKLIVIASPTGTGQVNYVAMESAEYLSRGDCVTVALQYSKRPSPMSLDRVWVGRKHFRMLLSAIRRRLYAMAPADRPRLAVFGESLGAHTSQDAFLHTGTQGLIDAGIDHALWIGTPHLSQWKRQVMEEERLDVDASLIGEFHGPDDLDALTAEAKRKLRFVLLTNGNDPVAYFGPDLFLQQPNWLGEAETRPPKVPGSQRWLSPLTFVETLIDMKNALDIVAGEFVANGHDYRANLARFVQLAYDLDCSDEQLSRIEAALRANEAARKRRLDEAEPKEEETASWTDVLDAGPDS